jgi:hypothetical protein
MKWRRGYPHHQIYHILEKQRREIEELERRRKEEEKKAWKAARKFKDIISAEKTYRKDVDAEIYEVSIWDILKMYGAKPLFRDLWHMAEHCVDTRSCYRILVHFKLSNRESDLDLVREALKTGVDVEMIIMLLYQDKREEAVKLLRR